MTVINSYLCDVIGIVESRKIALKIFPHLKIQKINMFEVHHSACNITNVNAVHPHANTYVKQTLSWCSEIKQKCSLDFRFISEVYNWSKCHRVSIMPNTIYKTSHNRKTWQMHKDQCLIKHFIQVGEAYTNVVVLDKNHCNYQSS